MFCNNTCIQVAVITAFRTTLDALINKHPDVMKFRSAFFSTHKTKV